MTKQFQFLYRMRHIEYKAKRIDNGEWVHGCHVLSSLGTFIVQKDGEEVEVVYGTISQFTGVYDANENMIFENDIIKGDYDYTHLVLYDSECAKFAAVLTDYIKNPKPYVSLSGSLEQRWINEFNKIVIGNKFDNPEFIEDKKED